MKTSIIIIDDHQLFREGVKRILDFESSFDVVAEGDDGSEAMDLVEEYKPDVVIMDINMPNMNGVEATKMLVQRYPDTKVIILSIHDDENYVQHALKTGAQGYLLKEMDADALIEIRRPLHLLTRRECEVLQLLADGKSNRAIGETLYISEKTVKNHVSNILQKMNVNDRTQAVVMAIKNGWVEVK